MHKIKSSEGKAEDNNWSCLDSVLFIDSKWQQTNCILKVSTCILVKTLYFSGSYLGYNY